MIGMTKGIAHVSFTGGGTFLPARNPYDRQMLAEHVASRVRVRGQVQVLIDDQRWMVYLKHGRTGECCSGCGRLTDSACYTHTSGDLPYCVPCAFVDEQTEFAHTALALQRRTGT